MSTLGDVAAGASAVIAAGSLGVAVWSRRGARQERQRHIEQERAKGIESAARLLRPPMTDALVHAVGEKEVGAGKLGGFSRREELSRAWEDNKKVLSSASAEDWGAIEQGVEAALAASPHEATDPGQALMNLHLRQLKDAVSTLERLGNVPSEGKVLEDLTAMLAEIARQGVKQG